MPESTKIIDTTAVLGIKVFCPDLPATNLVDESITVEEELLPGALTAKHVHPNQDDSYQVLAGTLNVFLNGRWASVQQGESIRIPKGTVHAIRNSTSMPVRVLNTYDPGLRFQESQELMELLIRGGKLTGMSGLKNGIYLSLHSMKFRNEFVAVSPPDWLLRMIAKLGRILGFKLS
jgi:mannose-6-phosphate isomerase-like protein (cupin superfamily)